MKTFSVLERWGKGMKAAGCSGGWQCHPGSDREQFRAACGTVQPPEGFLHVPHGGMMWAGKGSPSPLCRRRDAGVPLAHVHVCCRSCRVSPVFASLKHS